MLRPRGGIGEITTAVSRCQHFSSNPGLPFQNDDLRAAPGQGAAGHQTRRTAADNEALHSTSPNSEMSFSPASSVTACSAREQLVYSRRRSSSVRAHSGHTAITPSNSMPFIM